MKFIKDMLTANSGVSSKRFLAMVICIFVMVEIFFSINSNIDFPERTFLVISEMIVLVAALYGIDLYKNKK